MLIVVQVRSQFLQNRLASFAAPGDEKELEKVLRKLDVAAAKFHSTSADFQFDSVETDPVPDTDVQKGTVYYERTEKWRPAGWCC